MVATLATTIGGYFLGLFLATKVMENLTAWLLVATTVSFIVSFVLLLADNFLELPGLFMRLVTLLFASVCVTVELSYDQPTAFIFATSFLFIFVSFIFISGHSKKYISHVLAYGL
jgi:hypothetical protein